MIDSVVSSLSLTQNGFVLLLHPRAPSESRRLLPILIGVAEAQSIALAMARKELPRPMTHDLMKRLLTALDASLERVQITRFEGQTFYGRLLLTRQGEPLPPVDARPSDAVALALRCRAPIEVAGAVYALAGVDAPPPPLHTSPTSQKPLDPRVQDPRPDQAMGSSLRERLFLLEGGSRPRLG